eukprot:TRINITY_DN92990_c0_g1_i1.p1 TRINITY_DN92990_c0_g1~~TRINITY_DN92990_c0_g1_i1.p1  ORF type:complete len:400 (+),score=123.03 TRINITY_DN92990_c0_g1_i1:65-1201(+)
MADDSEEPRNLEEPLMNLSNLGRTVDGNGLAYRTLNCPGMRLGNIKAVDVYAHLNHIDLSRNYIKDVGPLRGLQYVLKLNLSHNEIKDLKPWVQAEGEENEIFPQLLELDLSHNVLQTLPGLQMKALRKASFAHNDIMNCDAFGGHATLRDLDLSECRLQTLNGITACPALTTLNVSAQREILPPEVPIVKGKPVPVEEPKELPPPGIEAVSGLADLPALTDLNAAKNRIAALEGPWADLATLERLDLSGNKLEDAKPLEALRVLPKLRSLKVAENPFTLPVEEAAAAEPKEKEAEAGGAEAEAAEAAEPKPPRAPGAWRTDVIICHWRLAEIDGEAVTEEQLEQAKEENVRRLIEEQERKKAEEAAAAAAAEAEGSE